MKQFAMRSVLLKLIIVYRLLLMAEVRKNSSLHERVDRLDDTLGSALRERHAYAFSSQYEQTPGFPSPETREAVEMFHMSWGAE